MDSECSDSERLEKRERELSILNTIARELSSHNNLDYVLNTALAKVAELLDLQTGWIFLIDEITEKNYLAAFLNLPPALLEHRELLEGTCYCLELYQADNLKAAANINVITCSRLYKMVGETNGLRFHASIPLNANDKKLGVMNVASNNWKKLSNDDLKILYTIGDLLAIAIERARLFDKSVEYGAMEERYRLARELHDTLGQGIAAIILRLETADALLEAGADTEKVRNTINYTLELARNNLEEARRSVLNLRAAPLENKSLAEAIQSLVDDLRKKGNVSVNFEISKEYNLTPILESTIYRLTQEALNNIYKHAKAKNVEIKLEIKVDSILLIISDDGRGFTIENVSKDRHGLTGINERIKLLKGKFDIETCPDKGTRLTFLIPMEKQYVR